jgi:hypothetical protein
VRVRVAAAHLPCMLQRCEVRATQTRDRALTCARLLSSPPRRDRSAGVPHRSPAPPTVVMAAAQIEAIGRAFITHYYTTFDNDRSQLGPLYVSERTNGEDERAPHRRSRAARCIALGSSSSTAPGMHHSARDMSLRAENDGLTCMRALETDALFSPPLCSSPPPPQQPQSLLTFEGLSFQGAEAIVDKFKSLPFAKIQHVVKSVDCAPSAAGIIVFVTGDLKVESEANALKFGQVFLLMPTAPQSQNFYVHNDVFRLNYG